MSEKEFLCRLTRERNFNFFKKMFLIFNVILKSKITVKFLKKKFEKEISHPLTHLEKNSPDER